MTHEIASSQKKTRCLGLVGGLGVGAAIHYYRELALAAERDGRPLDLAMAHAQTSRVFEYVDRQDAAGLAQYLNGFLARLKSAGAELAVIPAVTPHYAIRELEVCAALPLVSIFNPASREIAARSIRRASVFGTRQVMRSSLYDLLENVDIIPHPEEELATIHTAYQSLLDSHGGTMQQHAELTAIAHRILARDHVDAILLAGTDLSLVFNPRNTDFPHIDIAALHLQAIQEALFSDR